MSKEDEIELALKLTEIKFKNYTFDDFCHTSCNVLEFFDKSLKEIKNRGWLENE